MSAPRESLLESRLAELAARAEPSPDGWDQIQVRARHHDRRRRATVTVALSVAALLGAVAVWPRLRSGSHATGVSVHGPTSLAPAPAPGPGPGRLPGRAAWISDGKLWLLDEPGVVHAVAGSAPALDPAWSHDGQWVSYLRRPSPGQSELWVVHPDGSGNRRLWRGKLGGFVWSPTADELAVSAAPAVGVGGLTVVATDGTLRNVVTESVEVNSFAWSPDGRSIAYAEVTAPAATLRSPLKVVTVRGPGTGGAVTIFRATPGDGIVVAGWWPSGGGLLFWVEPQYSKSIEADGLPLQSVAISGAAPVTLTTTLVYLPWLVWAPDGRVLVVSGAGRLPSEHKTLSLCTPSTGACTSVVTPGNTVALDPSLSPDGTQVAFVVADASEAATPEWYRTRRLWVGAADALQGAHPVAGAAGGAATPSWSADGQAIRYTTERGVEAISATGGEPQPVSGPTPLTGTPGLDGPTAYGKAGWSGHAVWAPASS
jgi:TolB protein